MFGSGLEAGQSALSASTYRSSLRLGEGYVTEEVTFVLEMYPVSGALTLSDTD